MNADGSGKRRLTRNYVAQLDVRLGCLVARRAEDRLPKHARWQR